MSEREVCQFKTEVVLVNAVSQYNPIIPHINASVKMDINQTPRHRRIQDPVLFRAVIKKVILGCNLVQMSEGLRFQVIASVVYIH